MSAETRRAVLSFVQRNHDVNDRYRYARRQWGCDEGAERSVMDVTHRCGACSFAYSYEACVVRFGPRVEVTCRRVHGNGGQNENAGVGRVGRPNSCANTSGDVDAN